MLCAPPLRDRDSSRRTVAIEKPSTEIETMLGIQCRTPSGSAIPATGDELFQPVFHKSLGLARSPEVSLKFVMSSSR
jgi:hypothetical protein